MKPKSAGANFHLGGGGYIDFIMNNFGFFLISLKIIVIYRVHIFFLNFIALLLLTLFPTSRQVREVPQGYHGEPTQVCNESHFSVSSANPYSCQSAPDPPHSATANHSHQTEGGVHSVFSLPYRATWAPFPALFLTSLFSL